MTLVTCSFLALLDLSATFDTIDHSILIDKLDKWAALSKVALNWFRSYLNNVPFVLSSAGLLSSRATRSHGVPQGSVLGPALFSICCFPLATLFVNILYHCYADEMQVYIPVRPKVHPDIMSITGCLVEIRSWMLDNFLKLNETKTEMIVFGPQQRESSS